jgi:undecaprenyl-diphosphatase
VSGRIELSAPPWVDHFDEVVDEWFEQLRGIPVLDRLFYAASELGDFSLIWHLVGATRAAADDSFFPRAVRLSALLGVESLLVNGAIKSLFLRERPTPPADAPHHLRTPKTSSFPSGHSSSAFTAAGLATTGPASGVALHALAVVVSCSRVHVRIHHASDVVAGAVLGVALGQVGRRLWPLR